VLEAVKLIGSACVLYVICYVIVDLLNLKKVTTSDVISRIVLLGLLFLVMLRT